MKANHERKCIAGLLARLRRQPTRCFPKRGLMFDAPDEHGVYIITDPKRRVVLVGRTLRGQRGLYQRLRNHLQGQSSFVLSYLHGNGDLLRKRYSFQYLEVADCRQRALLEALATSRLCPRHIGIDTLKKM